MNIGAPHSPARWLSENIGSLPAEHTHALMGRGPVLIISGTKAECKAKVTDLTEQVICELGKYR